MIVKQDMLCVWAHVHVVLTFYLHVQVRILVGLPDISHTNLPTSRNKNKSAFWERKIFIFISREEIVDLQKGDQHIMRYKPLSGLVMSGAVSLI